MTNKYFFDVEEFFDKVDQDNNKILSKDEVTRALKASGVPTTPSLVKSIFNVIDTDKNGQISYQEFKSYADTQEQKLQKVFQKYDKNGNGSLNSKELKEALIDMGAHVNDEIVNTLVTILDKDQSGQISYKEFASFSYLIPSEILKQQFVTWTKHSFDIGESVVCEQEKTSSSPPAYVTLLAGGIAGTISRTMTAPLDILKVIMQAQTQGKSASLPTVAREIYSQGGLKSFWKGNGCNVIKIAPETACKFIMYDKIKALTCKNPKQPTTVERLMSGAVAGFCSQSLIYPLEVCKTRLALSPTGTYNGVMGCMRTIQQQEGTKALYKGWGPAVIGIIPYVSIDLCVYNSIKDFYVKKYADDPSTMFLLCSGAFSGVCGQLVSYPLARIRTILQSQGSPGRPVIYNGLGDCFTQIMKKEGPKGFYRGILPNFMKSIPAISISYACYENIKKALI